MVVAAKNVREETLRSFKDYIRLLPRAFTNERQLNIAYSSMKKSWDDFRKAHINFLSKN